MDSNKLGKQADASGAVSKSQDAKAARTKGKSKKKSSPISAWRTIEFYRAYRLNRVIDTQTKKEIQQFFEPAKLVHDVQEALKDIDKKAFKLQNREDDTFIAYLLSKKFLVPNTIDEYVTGHLFHMRKIRHSVRSGRIDLDTYDYEGYSFVSSNKESAEPSHCMIFEDGFAALEFNLTAPRLEAFEDFVNQYFAGHGPIEFGKCVLRNHIENMQTADVREVRLDIRPSDYSFFKTAFGSYKWASQLDDDGDVPSLGTFSIVMTAKRRKNLNGLAAKLVGGLTPTQLKEAKKKKMINLKARNLEAVSRSLIDIFASRITCSREIQFGQPISNYQLDPESVANEMYEAYKLKYTDLLKSVSLKELPGDESEQPVND